MTRESLKVDPREVRVGGMLKRSFSALPLFSFRPLSFQFVMDLISIALCISFHYHVLGPASSIALWISNYDRSK